MTTALARPEARRTTPRRRSWAAGTLLVVLGLDLGAVAGLALARLPLDAAAPGGLALWGGRATGLLAQVLVLGLVLLAARVPVLERAVGQDRLLRWHRWLAPAALVALVSHPLLLAVGHTGGWWGGLISLGSTTTDALVGTVLFLAVSAASVRAVRRRTPYEGWHLLHLSTYAAVVLVFLHQLGAGSAVLSGGLVRGWWLAQVVVVLAAALVFRVVVPLWNSTEHSLRVADVQVVGADVVSVTVRGRDLDRLGASGGQFLVWRFLDRSGWWRAHPFSLSRAPTAGSLRLTAREVGDGTRLLRHLRPGTRVHVEGPYGVLTAASRKTDRLLLVGGGLGIAPLRALLEDLPDDVDVDVVQRAPTVRGAVLHDELQQLAAHRPATRLHLVTGPRGAPDDPDRPLGMNALRALVPDVAAREAFVCGPAGMTHDLMTTLTRLGVPSHRFHSESFEL